MTYLSAPTYCTNFPVRIEKGGKKKCARRGKSRRSAKQHRYLLLEEHYYGKHVAMKMIIFRVGVTVVTFHQRRHPPPNERDSVG